MRLSCNGCRVLRKGCTDACTIRPCLQWIKTPEAQANATVFLAKFYGRAGLLNLLAASPSAGDMGPAVFRSLLHEACGRVVNPVYGAVGLLWSGTWHMCQAAVEAVLKGEPIVVVQQQQLDHQHQLTMQHPPPVPNYDIRHVVKQHGASTASVAAAAAHHASPPPPPADAAPTDTSSIPPDAGPLHKVAKPGRTPFKFKRAASSSSRKTNSNKKRASSSSSTSSTTSNDQQQQQQHQHDEEHQHAIPSSSSSQCHDASSDHHHHHHQQQPSEAGSSHVTTAAPSQDDGDDEHDQEQLGLHLTLGFFDSATAPPPVQTHSHTPPPPAAAAEDDDEPGPGILPGFQSFI